MISADELRNVPLFDSLDEDDLLWVRDQGAEVRLEPGEVHRNEGDPADHVFVMLDGEIRVTQKVGEREVVLATYGTGTFFGELPILLGIPTYFAGGRATKPTHILELQTDAFWEVVRSCPAVSVAMMKTMAERIQDLAEDAQRGEKLASLGKLSAGLAHELNNPAAAGSRSVGDLRASVREVRGLALELGRQLDAGQLEALVDRERDALERAVDPPDPDSLERGDLEDDLALWLEEIGVEEAWDLATTLVSAGLDKEWLADAVDGLPSGAVGDAVRYLCAALTVEELFGEAEGSVGRISDLVGAMKGYSQMDRSPLQEVDVNEGIENTLAILGHRAGEGVEILRDYDEDLPRIEAYGGELNQAWTEILDNAIDAVDGEGRILVRTACEADHVLVEVTDDGPGIAPEDQGRVFEPFFTTRDVGEGTGLGLDAAYRTIVGTHNGDVRVRSEPGETTFQVRLPVGGPGNPT